MSKRPKREWRKLDTTAAAEGVWLVKVPNYLSQAWSKSSPDQLLGTLTVGKTSKKIEAQFNLNAELSNTDEGIQLPRQHRVGLVDTSTTSHCMYVFSEDQNNSEVQAEGKVQCRANVLSADNALYTKLKKYQIHTAGKTKFTATHLSETPNIYKPVDRRLPDKKDVTKRARDDKGKVYELLFSAFQHHQYYTFKDLVNITKQPPTYLKEVLKEVCLYNTKAPHKHTWELKSEYKHKPS